VQTSAGRGTSEAGVEEKKNRLPSKNFTLSHELGVNTARSRTTDDTEPK